MKILCCQLNIEGVITRSSMEIKQQSISNQIRTICLEQSVDLVFLPELSTIEYSNHAFDNIVELATDLKDWLVGSMSELAREVHAAVCFGMPRRGKNGIYICQVLVDRNGVVKGYYDKVHLADIGASVEKRYFTPGDHALVTEIDGYRTGIVICYDMRFGEYISTLVRQFRLDIILHPVAFYRDGTFASWRNFVCTRALENQVFWLSLNRAGPGWGKSIICPPWFEQQSEVFEFDESETYKIVEVDKKRLKLARKNYPLAIDRLNNYSELIATPVEM